MIMKPVKIDPINDLISRIHLRNGEIVQAQRTASPDESKRLQLEQRILAAFFAVMFVRSIAEN